MITTFRSYASNRVESKSRRRAALARSSLAARRRVLAATSLKKGLEKDSLHATREGRYARARWMRDATVCDDATRDESMDARSSWCA